MTLIRLNSDNYDNVLMTPDAYEYVALGMSSGDHGSHTAAVVVIPEEYVGEYLCLADVVDGDYTDAPDYTDPDGYFGC